MERVISHERIPPHRIFVPEHRARAGFNGFPHGATGHATSKLMAMRKHWSFHEWMPSYDDDMHRWVVSEQAP
jgi:hypothetical protein